MQRVAPALVVAVVIVLGACDDMTGGSGVPNVAGTYSGPVLLRFPDLNIEVDSTARLTVVQSGEEVTIHGSLTLAGVTSEIPAFTGTINSTGFFTVTGHGVAGTSSDATCGQYRPVSSSLTFDDGTARLVENVSTDFCSNIHLSGTLTR